MRADPLEAMIARDRAREAARQAALAPGAYWSVVYYSGAGDDRRYAVAEVCADSIGEALQLAPAALDGQLREAGYPGHGAIFATPKFVVPVGG